MINAGFGLFSTNQIACSKQNSLVLYDGITINTNEDIYKQQDCDSNTI